MNFSIEDIEPEHRDVYFDWVNSYRRTVPFERQKEDEQCFLQRHIGGLADVDMYFLITKVVIPISCGRMARMTIPIEKPGRDKWRKENQIALQQALGLWNDTHKSPILAGEVDEQQNCGSDGEIRIRDVKFPLEIGTCGLETLSFRLFQDTAIARWPYDSEKLYLFKYDKGYIREIISGWGLPEEQKSSYHQMTLF